jgi:outer membrane protein assembly factor BamB
MLGAMIGACILLAPRGVSGAPAAVTGEETDRITATPVGVVWTFEPKDRGVIDSSPLVVGNRVYVAAAHAKEPERYGILYCLDRATGKQLWSFDDEGDMKQVFSTPAFADGKIYVGEGFHQDRNCKMYCVNAETGKKVWQFYSNSHTESSPCVVDGKVYFGAGDDGVYCLDAATGKQVWQYPGLHVDSNPAVVGGRLYVGSGVGDLYRETVIFCLDTATGKEAWRIPVDLPAWGSPRVSGGYVFFGLGNGNFYESDGSRPGGAVLCVEAATGKRYWRCDVPDAVLDRPAVDRHWVWFGSRDGHLYCVDRTDGQVRWKQDLGSPVVTAPTLARGPGGGGAPTSVYAAGSAGQLYCLDPETGKVDWTFDVGQHSKTQPELFSTPSVVVTREADRERRLLFLGTGLYNFVSKAAVLYCYEDYLKD